MLLAPMVPMRPTRRPAVMAMPAQVLEEAMPVAMEAMPVVVEEAMVEGAAVAAPTNSGADKIRTPRYLDKRSRP